MGKIKVQQLAQELGIENKELLEKLATLNIPAKTSASSLEVDDVKRVKEEILAHSVEKVEKVEEQRINSGIIRRRRREVPPPDEAIVETPVAAAPKKAATPVTADESAAEKTSIDETVTTIPAKDAATEKKPVKKSVGDTPVSEPAVEIKTPPADVQAAVEVSETVQKTDPGATKTPAAKAKERPSSSHAKILGRVELPQPTPPPQRRERSAGGRPAGPGGRPAGPGGRPAGPGGRPAGPGGRPAGPGGRPAGPPSIVPVPTDELEGKDSKRSKKRKSKAKGVPGVDFEGGPRKTRREVYEPDRGDRHRKARRSPKQTKKTEITVSKAIKRVIKISESITVGELAKRMGVKANELIRELMRQGSMVTINHPLDYETAALLASEFNYEVENVAFDEVSIIEHSSIKGVEEEKIEDMEERPAVVTIMGHVDHGKTSLLDAIRLTNVTDGEAGGITQHIGAYSVELDGRKITFLDTPGHEAFTAMRARGAQVTDIVIVVVAADDGVMPQTREAINHAKAAGVPIIVAVNKIDKPNANPDRVKQEMNEFGLVPEEWGGETIFAEVSAKMRTNLEGLLEMILLQAEVLELKANPKKRASGTIVEARLDRGRGPVSTILVQEGTLKVGDPIVGGAYFGRVRTMLDDRGNPLQEAGPSCPVEVTGLTGVPDAGDTLNALDDEKTARDVAQHRQQKIRELELAKHSKISLDQLYARIQLGDVKELKVVIKADVQGSLEAVSESLAKLSTDACRLVVIHTAVGGITESDVTLAAASDAIVLGFNVRPEVKANSLAETEGVDIRLYSIIYDAVADVRDAMEGLLAPKLEERYLGRAEVRDTFSVSKVGTIAGSYVIDGKVIRNANARLLRDNVVIWTGKLSSLKRFKDDAREVATNYECGIGLENYNDIKVGDIVEFFEIEEVKAKL
ncbi:MAG: translation initiation factor IF-2 [Desulfuromonadales bacterium]|nr:translation initiation factor IF-2 [Desulfuromonadales bacterium]